MNTNQTKGRPSRSTTTLKAALIAGSMVAAVMGTGLIARQDVTPAAVAPTVSEAAGAPLVDSAALPQPPSGPSLTNLPAIPRAAAVNIAIVARSQSSR